MTSLLKKSKAALFAPCILTLAHRIATMEKLPDTVCLLV